MTATGMEDGAEIYASLRVLSIVLSARELVQALGVVPDKQWGIGDTREKTSIRRKENGWEIVSALPLSAGIEEHINALLLRAEAAAEAFNLLGEDACVLLSCAVYCESVPALFLSAEVVKRLAAIGAGLDLDVYVLE